MTNIVATITVSLATNWVTLGYQRATNAGHTNLLLAAQAEQRTRQHTITYELDGKLYIHRQPFDPAWTGRTRYTNDLTAMPPLPAGIGQ